MRVRAERAEPIESIEFIEFIEPANTLGATQSIVRI